jgi:hypothetical protein
LKSHHHLPPVAWARRVNRLWIVHARLGDNAEAWMNHLEASGDGRLEKSCLAARAMCGMRPEGADPKPWFYSGLFSAATREEAQRFLSSHLVTKAAIPSMADDEDVRLWLEGVGSGTRKLLQRLRASIGEMGKS